MRRFKKNRWEDGKKRFAIRGISCTLENLQNSTWWLRLSSRSSNVGNISHSNAASIEKQKNCFLRNQIEVIFIGVTIMLGFALAALLKLTESNRKYARVGAEPIQLSFKVRYDLISNPIWIHKFKATFLHVHAELTPQAEPCS